MSRSLQYLLLFAVAFASVLSADQVPMIGPGPGGAVHANPFPPGPIYSTPLPPGTYVLEPVNDGLPAFGVPWLDEVEWILWGAPAKPVTFTFGPGTAPVAVNAGAFGAGFWIYVAYTQPDDLGLEVGGSQYLLGNLTPFLASYGLGITENPGGIPPPGPGGPPVNPVGIGPGPVPIPFPHVGPYYGASVWDRGASYEVRLEPVPEPAAVLLLGACLATVGIDIRRRRRNRALSR